LHIVDIEDATKPKLLGKFNEKHTMPYATCISRDGKLAYVGDNNQDRLEIIDISDPTAPFLVGKTIKFKGGKEIAVSKDNKIAYLSTWSDGIKIIDISKLENPTMIGSIDKSIIVHPEFIVLSNDGKTAYIGGGSGVNGGLFIVDVSNPRNPKLLSQTHMGEYDAIRGITLSSDGKIAYLSDYDNGMYIADISDAKNPKKLGHADLIVGGVNLGIHGDGNTVSISSNGTTAYVVTIAGLFVIDVSNPKKPTLIGSAVLPGNAQAIAISEDDTKAYIQTFYSGLVIVDLTVFD
jgi:hypothetical protein